MEFKEHELKKGIKLHTIKTGKFKTNLMAIFLTTKLNKEDVTKNAVISAVLRRGSKNMTTQEEISKQMEELYGASFDCGLDKMGDNQVIKFYIETVNDTFLPQQNKENILKIGMEKLMEIVFNPFLEGESFKPEYVEQEKNNIKQRIEGKSDNKARYALDRCIEEMYGDEPYGLYKFGYIEDLEQIDGKNLYEQYKKMIKECKIDIFISGLIDDEILKNVQENENIIKLEDRDAKYVIPEVETKKEQAEKVVVDRLEVSQGKLVLGLDVSLENESQRYDALIYNSILGGSANSKMFQNVREKAHLAYVASSSYRKYKNNIFVNCGIEIENYEKALGLIKEQIEDMKQGNFTEEDIQNAKKGIIASIKTIDDEQDTGISYCFGQELQNSKMTLEEYMKKVEKVKKEDILKVANNTKINTIYFLRSVE